MPRQGLLLAIAVGLGGLVTPATAQPITSPAQLEAAPKSKSKPDWKAAKAKRDRKAKLAKRTKAKAKARAKAKRVAKARARAKQRRNRTEVAIQAPPATSATDRGTNMPRGWAWPASPQMVDAGQRCEAELDRRKIAWTRGTPEGHIPDPITVPGMMLGGVKYTPTYRKGPHVLDCHLALILNTIGPQLRALGVREVKFGSIFRWTNVRVGGETKGFLSRHALGIAMDIMSFVDDNGRTAVVESDYPKQDPLLLAIERAVTDSGKFRTVLTPQNDPISHDDHFHIEVAIDYTTTPAVK